MIWDKYYLVHDDTKRINWKLAVIKLVTGEQMVWYAQPTFARLPGGHPLKKSTTEVTAKQEEWHAVPVLPKRPMREVARENVLMCPSPLPSEDATDSDWLLNSSSNYCNYIHVYVLWIHIYLTYLSLGDQQCEHMSVSYFSVSST